jgi:hypothetical protein
MFVVRKLSKRRGEELIARIVDDVALNMYDYQKFVLDCVENVVRQWGDDELLDWVDEKK